MSNYAKYKDLGNETTESFTPQPKNPLPAQNPGTGGLVISIQNTEHKKQLIMNNKVVVVDVYADWCMPCKSMASRYEQLANKYSRQGICCLTKENIDLNISQNIQGVPNIQFFKNGQYITPDITGANVNAIEQRIIELLD